MTWPVVRGALLAVTVLVMLYAPTSVQVLWWALWTVIAVLTSAATTWHRITHPRPRRHCCR